MIEIIAELQKILPKAIELIYKAGFEINRQYQSKSFTLVNTDNHSPISSADIASNNILKIGLPKLSTANYKVISEESLDIDYTKRRHLDKYWLIDPLDGTKEFIAGSNEFTINVAFIINHIPYMGIVYVPALDILYWAIKNKGAFRKSKNNIVAIKASVYNDDQPLRIILSSHQNSAHYQNKPLKKLINNLTNNHEVIICGSTLKICKVAQGDADIYPRFGQTGEWDTAAGQCILEEAGGKVISLNGKPLRYNKRESLFNSDFIACGNIKTKKLLSWLNI